MGACWVRWSLLATLLVGVAGCAGWLPRAATQEEERAFASAERAHEKDPGAGRDAFEAFLAHFPDSPLVSDAEFALGDIALRGGDTDEAVRRYARVAAAGGSASDRARVQLATLALERAAADDARRWLEGVRLSRLEPPERRNAYRALTDTAERPAERVRWLALLRGAVVDPAEVASLDMELDALLGKLPASELEDAARYVGTRPPGGRVYTALAERALEAGDLAGARRALAEASRRPMAPRYAPRLAALEARITARESGGADDGEPLSFQEVMTRPYPALGEARGSLGVVLPLSGTFARYGEEALQGVLLATGTFPETDGARPQVRVVVRDSGGDAERAAAAVRDLAADPEIVAIVGPVVSAASEAAAREAEEHGVPLLALTAREVVARDRGWVFRVRTRPAEEAELLAERAIALGAERFAILYPQDPYGRGLRALFWDAVETRGGQVVGVASFDPDATDFGESIRRLVGYSLLDAEERRLLASRESLLRKARRLPADEARAMRARARSLETADGSPIPPIVDFDALFIPGSHEEVVLIAPQLAFHEVTGTRLLGTDGGFTEDLLRLAGDHVEGALFASHFFPDSPVPYVGSFRRRFEEIFESEPGAFAAQSYDAASLVLLQLADGETDRGDVRDGLLRVQSFPGVSGVLSMRLDGNAHKRPFLIGIERGEVLHYID